MTSPLTPLNLAPAAGSTVTTSNFMTSCTLRPWPVRTQAEFQFATNSGFTTGVHTSSTTFKNPGSVSVYAGTPRLPNGSVWVRVRAVEITSLDVSAWSASAQLTIAHGGNALLLYPGQGDAVPWVSGSVAFDWEFRDTSEFDSQTSYQVRVQTNDGDNTYGTVGDVYASYGSILAVNTDYTDLRTSGGTATLYDSGKINSALTTRTVTVPAGGRNELIRWSVQTWDDDDVTAGVQSFHQFFLGDLPTIDITAPLTTTNTPTPPITWNYGSAAGHAQQSFRVSFYRGTTGELLFDSGLQAGATTSYTPPSQVLRNGENVTILVDVISSIGMQQSDSVVVTPTWIAPPNPSFEISAVNYDFVGRVDLDWAGAPESATFIEWRVYRRASDQAVWLFLGATQDDSFIDHSAPPLDTVQYAVTQVGTAFGVQVESALYPIGVDLSSTVYLLKVKDDPGLALRLTIVTADSFDHQYEQEIMDIMDVGRRAEVGTSFGRAGSLTVHFRDMGFEGGAADAYKRLLEIKESKRACYLRIPFKETLEVHIGDLSVARMAGVVSELNDITIPYTEVTR